ncbi:MAG TPA: alkaline phosphatase family protein [Vicinamibacterales bacterium]|nr:alkaline phosphatase family protein [Vicinamibacterales bacterium]
MRFLRMLTNSLLAGVLGAAYLAIVVLQLNPHVPLASVTPWWWLVTLGALYGVHIAVACYVMIVGREFFAMDIMSPGWASVRVLAWLAAALAAGASVLMWFNVRGFESALGVDAARRMTAGAVATSASAVVLLAIAVLHFSFGRRGSRVGASLFTLAVVASLVLPIVARGAGGGESAAAVPWTSSSLEGAGAPDGPRVTLIALDGASLAYILPRAAEGRLPNFSRVIEGGAGIDLASIRPTQPDPVWATVATGIYPSHSGVRSAARYYATRDGRGIDLLPDYCLSHALVHFGFVRDAPRLSAEWEARPIWGVLSDAGVSSGVVRWPLTHPAQPARGFIVSDRFHQFTGSITEFERAAYPPGLLNSLQAASADTFSSSDGGAGFAPGSPEASALQRDLLYSRMARALRAERNPRFLSLRYEGLDTVGHYYLRYAQASTPRGVPEADRRRLAQVIERYYAFIDGEVGAAIDGMTPGDLLVVVSGFGMHRLNDVKRMLARALGDPDFSGTHDRAPDGFLLAYGSAVERGRHQRGSIVDVTPTLLYFFGLPVAQDMDGFARADLFTRAFTAERPITFIPSYRGQPPFDLK